MSVKALITGITGMVGSHLADFLLENTDWEIYGVCRWRSPLDNVNHLLDRANRKERIYFEYADLNDEKYINTRNFILSTENSEFHIGKYASGVGSPHTPEGYIWHISLAMQGLTTDDINKKRELLEIMKNTDAGTYLMHEGFNPDDPNKFTRDWFSWANMMFCELVLDYCGIKVKK